MKRFDLSKLTAVEILKLTQRPAVRLEKVFPKVQKILAAVRKSGDAALRKYTAQFDGVRLEQLAVTSREISAAEKMIPQQLKSALGIAAANITKFHKAQLISEKPLQTMPGVTCFRQNRAIANVGLYVPGGSAPLFSTVLMLALPARIAGCPNIFLCTPPRSDGSIAPEILYAAKLSGVHRIYKIGGAQAIAALAYGTETVPQADKIFGPGNQYVTAAKLLVSIDPDGAAIDMPAGPSELLVIADRAARPEYVAADLLSQAEHGADSQVVLITTSQALQDAVAQEIKSQLPKLPRQEIARKALRNSLSVLVKNIPQALQFSNAYAPEHLILNLKNPRQYLPSITNAGSVFLGAYSPEAVGDYASGTNHTLPTSGYARSSSGVSVDSFLKKITVQELTKKGLANIARTVITMAEAEQLQAHAAAVKIRF